MLYLYLTLLSLPFSLLLSLPLYLQILIPLLILILLPLLLQLLLRIEFAQAVDAFMTFEKKGNLCHIVGCCILENKNKKRKRKHLDEEERRKEEGNLSEEMKRRRREEEGNEEEEEEEMEEKEEINNGEGKEEEDNNREEKEEKKKIRKDEGERRNERRRKEEKKEEEGDFFRRVASESESRFWRNKNLRRMRQTFHSFLGVGFWKDSSSFYFSEHFEIVKEIMSQDKLYEFMNDHATKIAFEPSKPHWRVFMIRDDKQRRILVWKVHHSLGDGISLMSSILYLGGCESIKVHPTLFCGGALTGRTSCYRSEGVELNKLRSYARKNGVSLNDVMLALVSNALEKTYLRCFNQNMPEIRVMMAASLRGVEEQTGEIELSNKINFFSLKMEEGGEKEFGEKMRSLHTELGKLKSSLVLHFQNLTAKFLYSFLPSACAKYCLSLATKKYFIIFSSLPGPVQKIQIYKVGVSDIFFFVNGLQNMRIVLNLISYNGKVHLGVSCDRGSGVEAREVVKAFEEGVMKEVEVEREPNKDADCNK